MLEYIKFNCHIIKTNDIDNITPDNLLAKYKDHNLDYDLIYDDVKLLVLKCSLSVDKTTIFTTTIKAENNDSVCAK